MDFGVYLYRSGRLTGKQYISLLTKQFDLLDANDRGDGRCTPNDFLIADLEKYRPFPLGDVLKKKAWFQEVLDQEPKCSSLEDLLDEWWSWHLNHLEPISDYSLASSFGRRLYENQIEKKNVAEYLVSVQVQNGLCAIRDQDVVVILEGTSAFYVGMAAAARRKKVRIVTSNGGLIREYRENPKMRESLESLEIIGGLADQESRGTRAKGTTWKDVVGDKHDPTATVVIGTVHGLSPTEGPFAPDGDAARIRRELVEGALDGHARQVVFVADYTKQLTANRKDFGSEIFPNASKWREILTKNLDRLMVVTSPPPRLCELMKTDPANFRAVVRNLKFHPDRSLSQGEVADYESGAQKFVEIAKKRQLEQTLYHEAVS